MLTEPEEGWELLVVDNASDPPVSLDLPLPLRERTRLIREEKLGLTHARLRGIKEAAGHLLVFVDDDNELASDYLVRASEHALADETLGSWGAGRIEPAFEVVPPTPLVPYLSYLALRDEPQDTVNRKVNQFEATPCGAGLCVRAEVAEAYAQAVRASGEIRLLDRAGEGLACGGDNDLAWSACDLGMTQGVFRDLQLTHRIPAGRLTESYFERLVEGQGYSEPILFSFRGVSPENLREPSWLGQRIDHCGKKTALWLRRVSTLLRERRWPSRLEQRLFQARLRGMRRSHAALAASTSSDS